MDASERIYRLKEYLKIKASADLAKSIGIHQQRIYNIEQKKATKISIDIATRITKQYPEINLNWLLTGEGDIVHSKQLTSVDKKEFQVYPNEIKDEMFKLMQEQINYLTKANEQKDNIIKALIKQLDEHRQVE